MSGVQTSFDPDLLEGFERYEGIRIATVGEDGDVLILGHHADEVAWAAFAAFQVEYNGADELTAHPSEDYDLTRAFGAFSDHSEGCELVDCECEADDVCVSCRTSGNHEECEPPCVCAEDYDHDRPAEWPCSCECYCDEYAWWISETKGGHPVMWVRYSYEKARAKRAATAIR